MGMRFFRRPHHRGCVVVYSRNACPLCQDAEALLARRIGRKHVCIVDITTDRALEDVYVFRVPVVVVGNQVVAEGEISDADVIAIRRALAAAETSQSASR